MFFKPHDHDRVLAGNLLRKHLNNSGKDDAIEKAVDAMIEYGKDTRPIPNEEYFLKDLKFFLERVKESLSFNKEMLCKGFAGWATCENCTHGWSNSEFELLKEATLLLEELEDRSESLEKARRN